MANKRYLKEKPIRLFDQMISLKSSYIGSQCSIKGNTLIWCDKMRPTPLSREYLVLLKYRMWKSPDIWVIGDELKKLESTSFPHKYSIDREKKMVNICLYRYSEFNVCKFLSKTIIPWTMEWLYYYELWLSTEEWYGGGDHPSVGETKNKPDEKNQ